MKTYSLKQFKYIYGKKHNPPDYGIYTTNLCGCVRRESVFDISGKRLRAYENCKTCFGFGFIPIPVGEVI